MEARIALLEAGQRETAAVLLRMEALIKQGIAKTDALAVKNDKLDDRLRKIAEDVAELKGRVSQLPTTVTLLGFSLAILAMAGVLKAFVR